MDEIINNIIEIDKQAKSIFNEANNRNDNFDELVEDAIEKQKRIIDKEIFSFYQRKYKNPIYDNYNLKGEIERLKQEREDITRDKTELEKSKKQLENEIFGYKDDIAKLNAQINNIYQSKSWKVAKKLSKIKHVFKK